jgi:hypothetical protein
MQRNTEGLTYKYSRGFYDSQLSFMERCQSYDPEAANEVRIKRSERASLIGRDEYDPNLPRLQAEARRALSDPNYSADLGPYRLGPGGVGDGGSGASGPVPGTGNTAITGAYRTTVPNMILPASVHAQYNGRGLPQEVCKRQDEEAMRGYIAAVAGQGSLQTYRILIAGTEHSLAIMKQCEDTPAIAQNIEYLQKTRAQGIKNCASVEAIPGACLAPFRGN